MRIAFLCSPGDPEVLRVECDERLHTQHSDFTVFKTAWSSDNLPNRLSYQFDGRHVYFNGARGDHHITAVLAAILCALLSSDATGVESVQVTSYRLKVYRSLAVPASELEEAILAALRALDPSIEPTVVKSTAAWDLPDPSDVGLESVAMLGGRHEVTERRGLFGR